MALLPASYQVDLQALRRATGVREAELARKTSSNGISRLRDRCHASIRQPLRDPGVRGRDVSEDREIAFNAGSHYELIKLTYADFAQLVKPEVMSFSSARAAALVMV